MSGLRAVIAEDSVILREGLSELLASRGIEVVGAVGDAAGLLAAVAAHEPDVAVVDIRMPPTHTDEGLRAALELRRTHPDLGILVFSQHIETRWASDLLDARGAAGVGYLLKERVANVGEFVDALTRVANGGTALDPEVVTQFVRSSRGHSLDRLTPREREVLELMAEGRSNHAIAEHLVVSDRAIEKHVSAIFDKLDLPPTPTDNRRVRAVLTYLTQEPPTQRP